MRFRRRISREELVEPEKYLLINRRRIKVVDGIASIEGDEAATSLLRQDVDDERVIASEMKSSYHNALKGMKYLKDLLDSGGELPPSFINMLSSALGDTIEFAEAELMLSQNVVDEHLSQRTANKLAAGFGVLARGRRKAISLEYFSSVVSEFEGTVDPQGERFFDEDISLGVRRKVLRLACDYLGISDATGYRLSRDLQRNRYGSALSLRSNKEEGLRPFFVDDEEDTYP